MDETTTSAIYTTTIETTTTTNVEAAEVTGSSSGGGSKSEKSILIDLILGTSQCLKQEEDLNFINDIKQKVSSTHLLNMYDSVEIINCFYF